MSLNDMQQYCQRYVETLLMHLMIEDPNNCIGLFLKNLRKDISAAYPQQYNHAFDIHNPLYSNSGFWKKTPVQEILFSGFIKSCVFESFLLISWYSSVNSKNSLILSAVLIGFASVVQNATSPT